MITKSVTSLPHNLPALLRGHFPLQFFTFVKRNDHRLLPVGLYAIIFRCYHANFPYHLNSCFTLRPLPYRLTILFYSFIRSHRTTIIFSKFFFYIFLSFFSTRQLHTSLKSSPSSSLKYSLIYEPRPLFLALHHSFLTQVKPSWISSLYLLIYISKLEPNSPVILNSKFYQNPTSLLLKPIII